MSFTNWSCDKIFGEDEEVPDTYLNTSQYSVVAHEIITLWSDEGIPGEETFTGTFGDIEVSVVQSEPGILYFMIPNVSPGLYNLTINFGEYEGFSDLTVDTPQQIGNPEDIVNNVINIANNSLQDLEYIENQTGQLVGEQEKLFLSNTISEMNSVYSTLSASERQQFASFIMANPEMFGADSTRSVASGIVLQGFRDFMKVNMLKIMIAGGSFYLSFTAPEPTGLTKIIALASAIYLVKKVAELGMLVLDIYDASVVAEQSDLIIPRSELVFLNHEEIMFDVKLSYRTIYKEDMASTNVLLQEVISLIHTFLDYRDKIDGYILEFKSLFNISGGGLSPGPKRVSEIQTTTSNEVDGEGDLVDLIEITNSNVNVAITDRATGYIVARFSTCETEYQNFNFTYTYADPMVDDKDYEVLLIATEIIYHEITDPRDGKVYNTIDVGNQTWFAENLNYWGEDGNLGQCNDYYDNNCEVYGRYYDFSDAKGDACPPGWHLPSDNEWKQLELFLGMPEDEVDLQDYNRGSNQLLGSVLKNCSGWGDDRDGINSIGFGAIPGGQIRYESAGNIYLGYGQRANFWTSDGSFSQYPTCIFRSMGSYDGISRDEQMYHHAMPVRCVKD